jgi:hypothetical protein
MNPENPEKKFSVQSVQIEADFEKVFNFIANPANLPTWTAAFREADTTSAVMATPSGELKIGLETKTSREKGTIDWYMTMPDGTVGAAYSRVVKGAAGKTIYSFILLAPPVPVEQIEGTLKEQEILLKKELQNLQSILA